MIKKFIPLSVLVVLMMALTVSVASAAQGQITEVNPSGVALLHANDVSGGQVEGALQNPRVASLFPSTSLGGQLPTP